MIPAVPVLAAGAVCFALGLVVAEFRRRIGPPMVLLVDHLGLELDRDAEHILRVQAQDIAADLRLQVARLKAKLEEFADADAMGLGDAA